MIKTAFKQFASAFGGGNRSAIFHSSLTCPECGSKLFKSADINKPDWSCPNLDCPAQIRARVAHWCSPEAMDIPSYDPLLLQTLVERGLVRDVAEFYRLKAAELAILPGMNQEAAQRFFEAITASMKRDAWRLMFGLSIPLVGRVEAEALGRGFPTVDAVFAAGTGGLVKNTGITEAMADSIVRWYSDSVNRKLIKRLMKSGLNFKSELYAKRRKP